jgi:hypothetical protein
LSFLEEKFIRRLTLLQAIPWKGSVPERVIGAALKIPGNKIDVGRLSIVGMK